MGRHEQSIEEKQYIGRGSTARPGAGVFPARHGLAFRHHRRTGQRLHEPLDADLEHQEVRARGGLQSAISPRCGRQAYGACADQGPAAPVSDGGWLVHLPFWLDHTGASPNGNRRAHHARQDLPPKAWLRGQARGAVPARFQ